MRYDSFNRCKFYLLLIHQFLSSNLGLANYSNPQRTFHQERVERDLRFAAALRYRQCNRTHPADILELPLFYSYS